MKTAFGALLPALALLLPGTAMVPVLAQTNYPLSADSQEQPGVPKGDVSHFKFTSTKIYPGTERDCWVYVPKQYDPKTPACVMVFQDGGGFQDKNGWRVPTVFDNLIAKGDMPVTIGVFLNPGVVPPADPQKQLPRYNRSFEYDAVDDRYVRFLTDEIFPELGKKYNLTQDPNGRAICGASSGGIASFTAAWNRPDVFRRVYGAISSFTDLRGGNGYPPLIRKTEPKPIRVYLQEGSNDQDIYSGSWPLGNADVAAALKFAGYDFRYEVGDGGHDGRQGTALLPEALRFLWRDWKTDFAIKPRPADRQPVLRETLIAGEEWQEVPLASDLSSETGLCTGAEGSVWFAKNNSTQLWKVTAEGLASRVAQVPRIGALVSAPGNKLYALGNGRLLSLDRNGKSKLHSLRLPVHSSAATVDAAGNLYVAGMPSSWRGSSGLTQTTTEDGIRVTQLYIPSASVALVPDQSLLLVAQASSDDKYLLSARIAPDGIADVQPYHDLTQVYGRPQVGVAGMVCDANGWLYVATEAGIQMLDQAGRVNGILLPPRPERGRARGLAWGGPNREYLYTTVGSKLYRRKTKARGVTSSEPPIKPLAPRL